MRNWWDYHKWYVICGGLLVGITIYLILRAFGIGQTQPDIQIAYIGHTPLPEDTVSSLEHALSEISGDFNGDGQVIVCIHQYLYSTDSPDAETAAYEYGSEIALIGDISDCDSYFFLMDDPEEFQRTYHVLALPDGGCPNELDYTTNDKVLPWKDCPVLAGMELGTYSATVLGRQTSGNNQELLSGLYLGRRCFYTEKTVSHPQKCGELWDILIGGSK